MNSYTGVYETNMFMHLRPAGRIGSLALCECDGDKKTIYIGNHCANGGVSIISIIHEYGVALDEGNGIRVEVVGNFPEEELRRSADEIGRIFEEKDEGSRDTDVVIHRDPNRRVRG